MITEVVHIGHANTIDLLLMADGAVPSLASVRRMTLALDNGTVFNSATSPASFDWTKTLTTSEASKIPGAKAGDSKLVLSLGALGIAAGEYDAELVVFDDEHTTGIVWGMLRLAVRSLGE